MHTTPYSQPRVHFEGFLLARKARIALERGRRLQPAEELRRSKASEPSIDRAQFELTKKDGAKGTHGKALLEDLEPYTQPVYHTDSRVRNCARQARNV